MRLITIMDQYKISSFSDSVNYLSIIPHKYHLILVINSYLFTNMALCQVKFIIFIDWFLPMQYCYSHLIALQQLLKPYTLRIQQVPSNTPIPGSFWGDSEAGLIQNTLYIRQDTPLHSALHEACHYICMDSQRRTHLHTNAEGDYQEENAVCYLQILLAVQIAGISPTQIMQDMDDWGYSFRPGSCAAWFYQDAEDARQWLYHFHLIDDNSIPTGQLR